MKKRQYAFVQSISAYLSGGRRREKMVRRVISTCIVLSVLGIASVIAYETSQRASIAVLTTATRDRLAVFQASFFSPIERFEYLPQLLAQHPIVESALLAPAEPQRFGGLNGLLEVVNRMTKSSAVYVINAEGMTIAASNWNKPDTFVGTNFSFRPYFQEAMRGQIGRFYGIGTVSGIPGYFFAYPVVQKNRTVGVVAVKIDLDDLDDRWEVGTDQVVVTDDSGIIFLSSNKDWKYRPTKPLSEDAKQKLLQTRQYASMLKPALDVKPDAFWPNVVTIRDVSNGIASQRYVVQSSPMPQAKWTVTIYSPMKDVAASSRRAAVAVAGGLAFLILLVLYVIQIRKRLIEKEAAREAVRVAHQMLETKHQELEVLSEHLRTMAISDPLTGCYNRRYFHEIAAKMVAAAQRHHRQVTILMIDVDFFKRVNDSYGHPAGDAVLKDVANVIKEALRQPDFLVRYGGEEFVVLLVDTMEAEAGTVAERVREAIASKLISIGSTTISVTVSIGLSAYIETDHEIDPALARADVALYQAKQSGRNRVVTYVRGMTE